jgi:propanol-preferring alcohol dehydrogenase
MRLRLRARVQRSRAHFSILGHEGAGHVVRLGSGVSSSTIQLGAQVGTAWLRDVCEVCESCLVLSGETRCLAQLASGRLIDGTFAECTVVPARYIIQISESIAVPDKLIALVMCGGGNGVQGPEGQRRGTTLVDC